MACWLLCGNSFGDILAADRALERPRAINLLGGVGANYRDRESEGRMKLKQAKDITVVASRKKRVAP